MARSNTGGTRGFLRGQVGSSLFQVTKDKRGKKIQLVRSVEASRQNNNTIMQAVARMQMGLLMGCLKQFKEIVDHSFEGVPYGQLSIAHFTQINIPLLQLDCKDNWESDNLFDYPTKGEPLLRVGAFIMAEGSLMIPPSLSFAYASNTTDTGGLRINCGRSYPTFGDLRKALGIAAGDYITTLMFQYDADNRANNFFMYGRNYLADLSDNISIDAVTLGQCFTHDENCDRFLSIDRPSGVISIDYRKHEGYWRGEIVAFCIILSQWDGQAWRRNNARFMNANPDEPWRDLVSPNEAFASWFDGYNPDEPFNPYK